MRITELFTAKSIALDVGRSEYSTARRAISSVTVTRWNCS